MTIAITCQCSAHLEVDERFAGQQIICPDCQASLKVPEPVQSVRRTSGFALASVTVALIGAFTVIGTILAVVFGVVSLMQIKSQPERLAGKNLAWTGIILGGALTVVGVFVYLPIEIFGLDPMIRRTQWLGKLEYPPQVVVQRPNDGFEISRPSTQWGILNTPEPGFNRWSTKPRDFLMVHPSRSAYVLVLPEEMAFDATFDSCKEKGIHLFRHVEMSGTSLRRGIQQDVKLEFYKKDNRIVEDEQKGVKYLEMKVDKSYRGQIRTFLLRIVKKEGDSLFFVVAAGTDKARFVGIEEELREALDSFRIVDRVPPAGGNQPFGNGF